MVRLTEAETRYLEDSRRILLEVEEADESAAGISATPRGGLFYLLIKKPIIMSPTTSEVTDGKIGEGA